jgi:hypothetical protein
MRELIDKTTMFFKNRLNRWGGGGGGGGGTGKPFVCIYMLTWVTHHTFTALVEKKRSKCLRDEYFSIDNRKHFRNFCTF